MSPRLSPTWSVRRRIRRSRVDRWPASGSRRPLARPLRPIWCSPNWRRPTRGIRIKAVPPRRGSLIALAEGDLVYTRNEGDGGEELFDDREDPRELLNRARDVAMQPVLRRFRDRLESVKAATRTVPSPADGRPPPSENPAQ